MMQKRKPPLARKVPICRFTLPAEASSQTLPISNKSLKTHGK